MASYDDIDPDEPYPMSLPQLGHAVIVNNVAAEMPGSMADVTALQTAYETVGFKVQVHTNLSAQEMRKVKKFIMEDETHDQSNCFALTIICHGNDKGHLLDKDKRKAWDTELFVGELSDVETLRGKPKIMIIQACRGGLWTDGRAAPAGTLVEDDDDVETTHILPDKADMFLAYATVPGYRAHGGSDGGSVYLQALATYLQQEYMTRPLDKILKMVRKAMVNNNKESAGMRQCSQESNTLINDVLFSEFHKDKGGKRVKSAGKKPSKEKTAEKESPKEQPKKEYPKKEQKKEKSIEDQKRELEIQAQILRQKAKRLQKREEMEKSPKTQEEAWQQSLQQTQQIFGGFNFGGIGQMLNKQSHADFDSDFDSLVKSQQAQTEKMLEEQRQWHRQPKNPGCWAFCYNEKQTKVDRIKNPFTNT